MKNLLVLGFVATLFVGCERIDGQLNVTNGIKLVNSDKKTRTIAPGTYTADIKANTKKKITLRLNSSDDKFVFNVPKNSIPNNGTFAFKSATVGQPVDIKGTVKTTVTDSQTHTGTQPCTYQEPVQVCYPTGPNGGIACHVQYQIRHGFQWQQWINRTTQKDVVLAISEVKSTVDSAEFIGDATFVERVILSQSMCR